MEFSWTQSALFAVYAAAAVLALLNVPVYFRARRPKRGTMEWMGVTAKRTPLRIQPLRLSDAAFALLTGLCAAVLRGLCFCLRMRLFSRPDALLAAASDALLVQGIPCLLAAAALYLLLRALFAKPLSALCTAVVGAVMLDHALFSAAALALSLLFLYFWVSAERNFAANALWLVLSGGMYAVALLYCWEAAWLAPLYLAAYVYAQIFRLCSGAYRVGGLLLSLFLCALAFVLCAIALWAAYATLSGRMKWSADLLRSFRFYRQLLPTLGEKLQTLTVLSPFGRTLLRGDWIVLFAGAAGCICALHGAVKLRDSRCLLILLVQLPFLLLWIFGGVYLLTLSLLLPIGWAWETCTSRGMRAFPAACAVLFLACYGATILI